MSSLNLENEPPQVDTVSGAASLLQKAQERRQQRETTLFLDVPTWDGDLIAEYAILGPDQMKTLTQKLINNSKNGNAEPGSNDIELLNAHCVGLYVRDPDSGDRLPVEDEFGIVNYARMARQLGKEHTLKTAAETIKYLMSERDKDDPDKYIVNLIAISLHAAAVQRWMRDPSKRSVDLEALLGEL